MRGGSHHPHHLWLRSSKSRAAGFLYSFRETARKMVMKIKEKFAYRVLEEGCGHLSTGRVIQLTGGRLIAQVSEHLKSNTCVRIDCEDALLFGEVLGCWREGCAMLVAVQVLHAVTGLRALARLREGYWESPKRLTPEVLKTA